MDLIIGLGNSSRQDDGAGWVVARRVEEMNLPGVLTRQDQQLGLEILEEWGGFQRVLLIDASLESGEVRLEKVPDSEATAESSTHELMPETLLQLSRRLYAKSPELYLCHVPGEKFDFGTDLSPAAQKNVEEAARLIEEWLKQGI